MNAENNKAHPISRIARALINGGLLASCLAYGSAASAAVTIEYEWLGVWTNEQKTAMNTAASSFSSLFGSHFSNTGTITLAATAYDDIDTPVLASAGSEIAYVGNGTFGGGEVVRSLLQGGGDLNGSATADGMVAVNFAYFTALGLNDTVPGGTYDFYSTLFHEYTHALGFASSMNYDGQPYIGSRHSGGGEWATFDRFLVDADGFRVVSDSYVLQDDVWGATREGGSVMYFNGANAVAANDGYLVNLYSPVEWAPGSSISHLDDESSYLATMMMASSTIDGPSARNLSAIEIGIMADLGYTPAVPEPETYALMLAGLGLVGYMARCRKA